MFFKRHYRGGGKACFNDMLLLSLKFGKYVLKAWLERQFSALLTKLINNTAIINLTIMIHNHGIFLGDPSPGVNLINIPSAAFTRADPRSTKRQSICKSFLRFRDLHEKAAHRRMMKLTPGVNSAKLFFLFFAVKIEIL